MSTCQSAVRSVAVTILILSLTGCASIVTGTTQSMAVETRMVSGQDIMGAHCRLTNSKGTWFVTTPGSVTIHRASVSPLSVNCTKENHQQLGVSSTKPKSKGMTWGNLLFGGVIGVITDGVTGAAGYYPSPITVIMKAVASITGPADKSETAEVVLPSDNPPPPSTPPAIGTPQTESTPVPAAKPESDWRNWGSRQN